MFGGTGDLDIARHLFRHSAHLTVGFFISSFTSGVSYSSFKFIKQQLRGQNAMKIIELIQDDEGKITVNMDGAEPMLFDTPEEALEMIQGELGGEDDAEGMDDLSEQTMMKDAMAEEQKGFASGFNGVRGKG